MKSTREELWTTLCDIVVELAGDAGLEPSDIGPDSMLNAELGLTSIDTIHMVVLLEDRVGGDLDLESLVVKDGEYVSDLAMSELNDFICQQLDIPD